MTSIQAILEYEKFFKYYDNDKMAYLYLLDHYRSPAPSDVNPTYRFNQNTVITVKYPQTESEKLNIIVNYKCHKMTLEFDDITKFEDKVPQEYFDEIDIEITRAIRSLMTIVDTDRSVK